MFKTLTAFAAAAALALSACGSDADGGTTSTPPDTAGTETPGSDAPGADTAPAASEAPTAAFPVTIEHKYGETTIDAEPVRVVSLGFGEHDGLLALGVIPVAVRDWYGDQPYATWPWAQDELGDAQPEVLPSADLNAEQIAALQPDLILGIGSGMTAEQYETLSQIAPTVAQPGDYIDYGTPWDVALEITGRAVGRSDEAAQVIADTKTLFTDAIAAHPEFEGATATVAFYYEDLPGAYVSSDIRSRALTDLGFVIPSEIDEQAGDSFYLSISSEDLSMIDTDVVVWVGAGAEAFENIRDIPTRPSLRAYSEGREVVADDLLSGAFSHSSPLSLEFVVETLVPELALAVDGDPATVVPSASLIAPEGTAADDDSASSADPAAEAAAVWSLVFDSAVPFDEKAPHLEDAEALASTVEAYATTGDMMGGITLDPTGVVVDGDAATVTYDILFGGVSAYEDQTGTMTRVDGTWTISRAEFCSFMASARTDCPA